MTRVRGADERRAPRRPAPTATIRPSRTASARRPAPGGVHRRDAAAGQDEVGGADRRSSGPPWSGGMGIVSLASDAPARSHRARRDEPGRRRAGRSIAPMTTVHLLHAGYAGDRVGQHLVLVRDGDALIVVGPGHGRAALADPRPAGRARASTPRHVTHVFLSHHHPDHTVNIALFPNAEVVDFWARYRDDLWLDHDGDGYHLAPKPSCG